jgi:hypothetical protein
LALRSTFRARLIGVETSLARRSDLGWSMAVSSTSKARGGLLLAFRRVLDFATIRINVEAFD